MDIPYRSFVDSEPFRFLIGPSQKPSHAHAGLFAHYSSPLDVLVNGPMAEAREKSASIEDVDEDTFVPFIEFLYTGDHSEPEPEILLTSSDITSEDDLNGIRDTDSAMDPAPGPSMVNDEEQPEHILIEEQTERPIVEDGIWSTWGYKSKKSKMKTDRILNANHWHENLALSESERLCVDCGATIAPHERKKDRLWSAFTEKSYVKHREPWEPRQNKEACESYAGVFLSHAHLYVLSDRYSIESLQRLTLQKLRLTLSRFTLFQERVPDVVELVKYTYKHTPEHNEGIDKLRSLVIDHVICHLEMVTKDKNFQDMLQEPGALAKDLLLKTLQRLD